MQFRNEKKMILQFKNEKLENSAAHLINQLNGGKDINNVTKFLI